MLSEQRRAQILLVLIRGKVIRRSWRGGKLIYWLEGVPRLREVEVWELRRLLEPQRGRALFKCLRLKENWWGITRKE